MTDEIGILKEVVQRLDKAGIGYMMTGSMAMALYSTPRMTRDIDIIINVSFTDVEKLIALFQPDFYIDRSSVREALRLKGMFNIIHNDSIIKVDFIVRKDEEYRIVEFSRKIVIPIEGVQISVVSPEDLVLSKLVWAKGSGSELQLRDVRQIMLGLPDLDSDYLKKWSNVLGVEDLLLRARNHE